MTHSNHAFRPLGHGIAGALLLAALAGCSSDAASSGSMRQRVAQDPTTGTPRSTAAAPDPAPPSAPTHLVVGDRARPLNVEGKPLFGWLPHDGPNELQSAYQIRVTRSRDGAVVWDSGKLASREQAYVPYAGPALAGQASHAWTVRTWDTSDRASAWAAPAEFDTGLQDSEWDASWIRRAASEPDDYTLARRELLVSASPVTRARVYVAAHHQYELSLNGVLVDKGPAYAYPGEGYYQATDVTDRVAAGPLALGVVYHWYGPGQGRPAGEPGLLVRLVVEHADGSQQVVVSDDSWRVARAREWQTGSPQRNADSGDYVERFDARQALPGWDRPGFAATSPAWAAPLVLGKHPAGVFTHLVGREARVAATPTPPVSVQSLADGTIVADFGVVMPARPLVHFRAGKSGRRLAMRAGYRLREDGHVASGPLETQGSDLSFEYVQREGEQSFRGFTHFAWRYLEIAPPGEVLDASSMRAIVEHVDVPLAQAASFASSDPTLDAVFALMQRSALYSAAYQFVDTPTREKGQFLADAANISDATMAGYLERDLTQQALREFAQSQARYWPDGRVNAVYPNGDGKRDIPDFTQLYVGWVWRYFVSSGDRTLLGELYPVLVNIAEYVWRHKSPQTGLITNLPGGRGPYEFGIVDWPPSGRFGYDMTTAARTTVNILGVDVMRSVAAAAEALGRSGAEVERFAQRARELTTAINARLRRADGIYVDGLDAAGNPCAHASQHASSYAIAFNIAPREDHAALGAHVASLGMQQGPMTAHWLLEALATAGRVDDVITRLTDAKGPGWGNVLAQGGTFTWESWAPRATESESHGWGAQSLVDFTQTLLGVRSTSPGAATVAVSVPQTSLRSARGSVPTQRGPVGVAWERVSSGALRVAVDVPVNVRAVVSLPVSAASTHSGRGEGAPRALGVEAGRARYEIGSGRSEFSVD